ncbi:MAG: hypothetical protein RLZZ450_3224 [Pseudomonadota bacterium]|jgi:hypothetical protein
MRNLFLVAALAGLTSALSGCAESAVQQDPERDSEADSTPGDLDASAPALPGDAPTGQIDGGLRRDSGGPGLADGSAADAGDGGPGSSAGDGSGRLDSGVRDAGKPPTDAGQPPKPDTGAPDAGPPVVDAGAPGCTGGTTMCGSQCADTKTSSQNCGACGTVCNNGSTCVDSKCTTPVTVPSGCTAKVFENRTYAFCTNTRNWRDARRSCIDAKMDLALVTSNAEGEFIKGNGDSWFAADDLDREGSWVAPTLGNAGSNNGPALTFTRWSAGEPSNTQRCDGVDIFVTCLGRRSDEDCGMIRGADGLWNDDDCDRSKRYVCEPL